MKYRKITLSIVLLCMHTLLIAQYHRSKYAAFDKLSPDMQKAYLEKYPSLKKSANQQKRQVPEQFADAEQKTSQSDFKLLKDINTMSSSHIQAGSNWHLAELNGIMYFSALGDLTGRELWRSDGTEAGTWLVKDIEPGNKSSSVSNITAFKDKIYFVANNPQFGTEVHHSDGTTNGTTVLSDVIPGNVTANISGLTVADDWLYFKVLDNEYREFIVATNGDWNQVQLVSRLTMEGISGASDFATLNNKLFFTAFNEITGREVYVADALTGAVKLIKNINPESIERSKKDPQNLTALNGYIYFQEYDGINTKLWRTDGTTAGTIPVSNSSSVSLNAQEFSVSGDVLYFAAITNVTGRELFKYNTVTPNGIELVADLSPGADSSAFFDFASANNLLYFVSNAQGKKKLWRTDGTQASTFALHSFNNLLFLKIYGCGNNLYFSDETLLNGLEPYISDGTQAGTKRLANVNRGVYSSGPAFFTYNSTTGTTFFSANSLEYGNEFWQTNGVTVSLVKDISQRQTDALLYDWDDGEFEENFLPVNNERIYFNGETNEHGMEAWVTDGTVKNTKLIKDLMPKYYGTECFFFKDCTVNGYTYFAGYNLHVEDTTIVTSIYKTDGTEQNTTLICETNDFVNDMVVANNEMVFLVQRSEDYEALFLYSALQGQTPVRLAKISSDLNLEFVPMATLNNLCIFPGLTESGEEPMVTDGTIQGTRLLKDISSGYSSSSPGGFILFQNKIYFHAFQSSRSKLWSTDGTPAGTQQISNIDAFLHQAVASERYLYFNGSTDTKGGELYKTDGTTQGTVLVKDIFSGPVGSGPFSFCLSGDNLFFFAAQKFSQGTVLWRLNTLNDSLNFVKDLYTNSSLCEVIRTVPYNNKMYFSTYTDFSDSYTNILWETDGTDAGTLVLNSWEQSRKTTGFFGITGNRLMMASANSFSGFEWFWIDLDNSSNFNSKRISDVTDVVGQSAIKFSPNPVANTLHITIPANKTVEQIRIADMNGGIHFQKQGNIAGTFTIDMSQFAKGMYILMFNDTESYKIVKQ